MIYKEINTISEIGDILDLIHDEWFDINEINFENHILSIKFRKEKNDDIKVKRNYLLWKVVEIPILECYLKIYNVTDYIIKDNQRVDFYDFNIIEYFENENKINIQTGIPLIFEINVYDFKVSVEEIGISNYKLKTRIF